MWTYLERRIGRNNVSSREFLDRFENAEMIISKGQGNYEGLSGSDRPIFFLLKAKCRVIADDIGVNEDDIVLRGPNIDYLL